MAATKASTRKSTKAKRTTTKRTTTKRTQRKPQEPKVWLGTSRASARLGQSISVSWRAAGPDRTLVTLWQVGPDGTLRFTVPVKGSRLVLPSVVGTYAWFIRDLQGKELARTEVQVRA